ncbi:MAG: polysaccharide biosynthesis protein [Cypionkella sp.]|uniref:oligosaccharide flippase family protein n=1 Tax=Cypionkella sp. TaxID=2811411 RepID=UPI0026287A76|nr:oligosaccharide flippase family protein [Cypionkella sp.]MDB5661575.1 polysaccharide biosynthesis protein [Cypionkella sp.]
MLRSAALILSGNAANAALLLMRNLLVARLISVEDYGIAATFSVAVAIIEMASTFGLQQQLVQDKRGDDPKFQEILQGIQLLRGLVNAIILFALAEPFADFMGVPQVAWAHKLLGIALIANGLVHLDMYRLSRRMRYRSGTIVAALSPLAAIIVIWPLYIFLKDYRVMLWSIIVQTVAVAVVSHWVAERPYRIAFDKLIVKQSLIFGIPLLFDGILLFIIFNGEKLIIGRELGMQSLALFSMSITLTLTPALILQKTATTFFLPQLSSALDTQHFKQLAAVTMQAHILFGCILVTSVVLCGAPFVHLVLGAKYQNIIPLLFLLVIMQALRVVKGGGATVSLARARTSNGMFANILRVAVLPIAWYVAVKNGSVSTVIWIGTIGELMGLVVSLVLMQTQLRLSLRPILAPLSLMLALLVVTGLGGEGKLPNWWPILLLMLGGAAVATTSDLRFYVRDRTVNHHGNRD